MAEKRLIDADKRIAEIKKQYCTDCNNYGGVRCRACWVDDAICLIDESGTVYAVPVVRCRECKYWNEDALACDTLPWVNSSEHANWYENDFCSYGERKDGDGNG